MARRKMRPVDTDKPKKNNPNIDSKLLGSYANTNARPQLMRKGPARVTPTASGGMRICNTEQFVSLNTSGTGGYGVVAFNPVDFPWVGRIAGSYTKYKVHSLVFSYVPSVGTTQSGAIDLGLFYDYQDATYWGGTAGGPDNLSSCGDWASGPFYAGGAVDFTNQKISDVNWFGVKADAKMAHATYPWLVVDKTTNNDVGNLSIPVSIAFRTVNPTLVAPISIGRLMVSYDLEFIQPISYDNQRIG